MAMNQIRLSREYKEVLKEMMKALETGCEPDEYALNQLKNAQKTLGLVGKQEKKRGKRKHATMEEKTARINALMDVWKLVLVGFTHQNEPNASSFQRAFTFDGLRGYNKFITIIKNVMMNSIDSYQGMPEEEKDLVKSEWVKTGGWIQNVAQDMAHNLWDVLVKHNEKHHARTQGVSPCFPGNRQLLEDWSKELILARGESNVQFQNKVTLVGSVSIESAQGGVRPSRCIPNVRSIHFLKPEQVINASKIGKGVQGEVYICHIEGCPLIPRQLKCVAKRFKEGNRHKRQQDALQELLMGGLNHQGIVGALGITIQDPPRLVYDYYNGGDFGGFIKNAIIGGGGNWI